MSVHSFPGHPVLDQWVEAINSRDSHAVEAILACYDPDASFLPTFAATAPTLDDKRFYFETRKQLRDLQAVINEVDIFADGAHAVLTGDYSLFSRDETGKSQATTANFTFVIKGKRIIHHHSSDSALNSNVKNWDIVPDSQNAEWACEDGRLKVEAGLCSLLPYEGEQEFPGRYTLFEWDGTCFSQLSLIPGTELVSRRILQTA